jgi:hypothetical protein|tara:strand:- start:329 stop:547 length:219 start_codon:yes stop_codon:yes gene_type:complete
VVVEEALLTQELVEMHKQVDLVVVEHGGQVQEQKLVLQVILHPLVHLKEIMVVMVVMMEIHMVEAVEVDMLL